MIRQNRPGIGFSSGHFGELLQGRLGADGPVALITLPCSQLGATARFTPGQTGYFDRGRRIHVPSALAGLLDAYGVRGRLAISTRAVVGGGAGASTATIVASLRASLGETISAPEIALACLAIEGATDPLMFDAPETILWASRQAEILGRMPEPGAFQVVGGFRGPARRTRADDTRFADISDLVSDWAFAAQKLDGLASLTTESLRRNRELRGPDDWGELMDLVAESGANGLIGAHTGSAVGLIFPKSADTVAVPRLLRQNGFHSIIRFQGAF